MFSPQEFSPRSIFQCLSANDNQRTWLLLHSCPAPLHPAQRDRLYFHPRCVLSIRQEAHTRAFYPRWMPCRNCRVYHAPRDEDASDSIRREPRCRGWPHTQCCDATRVGGRELRWRSEEGGCDRNSYWFWEPRWASLWLDHDSKDRGLTMLYF